MRHAQGYSTWGYSASQPTHNTAMKESIYESPTNSSTFWVIPWATGHSINGSTLKVADYRKFQNYTTVKGGSIPSKKKFKTQRNTKLRWLTTDVNFKLLQTGCPITHGNTIQETRETKVTIFCHRNNSFLSIILSLY